MCELFLWTVGTLSGPLGSFDQAAVGFDSLLPFWHDKMF